MIIPWQQVSPETLENLIETFVLREGTDYGEHERSLLDKVADVRRQLETGEVVLGWADHIGRASCMGRVYVAVVAASLTTH